MAEQRLEEARVPRRRGVRPGALEPAGDRVGALAGVVAVAPAEALLLERGALGLGADVLVGVGGAVRLAERVPARDERDRLLVVHRHAVERLADVRGRGERVRGAVRALGVDVDQAHLDRAEGGLEVAVAGVALVAEPLLLRPPVDVLVGLPDVLAAAGEAERLEAHRLQGDVAGEDHQVRPREALAVLLLDGPEQAAGLVEVRVVGPAVERGEALLAGAGAAAAVADAVGAGAVPGHPDHEGAVVAVVRGPPVLRGREDVLDVLLDRGEVEAVERGRVVEVLAERVGHGGVLGEDPEVEPVRPPAPVAAALGRVRGALGGERAAARVLRLVHLSNDSVRLIGHGGPFRESEGWLGQELGCGRACGAQAPVDDLGLVDRVAVVVGRGQAGRAADGAVDVGDRAARAAHQVVMVVADPRLVARYGARRVDAPDEAGAGQRLQPVVDGLLGDLTEVARERRR